MNDMIKKDDVLAIIEAVKREYVTHSVPDTEARVALRKVADIIREGKESK